MLANFAPISLYSAILGRFAPKQHANCGLILSEFRAISLFKLSLSYLFYFVCYFGYFYRASA